MAVENTHDKRTAGHAQPVHKVHHKTTRGHNRPHDAYSSPANPPTRPALYPMHADRMAARMAGTPCVCKSPPVQPAYSSHKAKGRTHLPVKHKPPQ